MLRPAVKSVSMERFKITGGRLLLLMRQVPPSHYPRQAANQWPALATHSPMPARLNGVESTTIRILEVVLVWFATP
jgi:hypothetical protein